MAITVPKVMAFVPFAPRNQNLDSTLYFHTVIAVLVCDVGFTETLVSLNLSCWVKRL
jgi:hypothetical protein